MLNGLWAGMVLIGILWGAFQGTLAAVTDGALQATKDAVTLSITMLGIMSFWSGILNIGEKAGLLEQLTKKIQPLICFLFPNIPQGHSALNHISINLIANMLGLGWAATPAGLKAMEALRLLEEERKGPAFRACASDEMCTFLIINVSSLQLIPINMLAYRSQYGSTDPALITGPVLFATALSTMAAILFVKYMQKK